MRGKGLWLFVISILALAGAYFLVHRQSPNEAKIQLKPTVTSGLTTELPLRINTKQAINAGEFYFSFPKDQLTIKEVRTTGSIFQLWVKDSPAFSNENGTVSIAGGLPTPGFTGNDGLVATIIYEAKSPGTAQFTLDPVKSRVLLNDGKGTQLPISYQAERLSVQ